MSFVHIEDKQQQIAFYKDCKKKNMICYFAKNKEKRGIIFGNDHDHIKKFLETHPNIVVFNEYNS